MWLGWSALSLPSIIFLIKLIFGRLYERIVLIFFRIKEFYISLRYERNRIGIIPYEPEQISIELFTRTINNQSTGRRNHPSEVIETIE